MGAYNEPGSSFLSRAKGGVVHYFPPFRDPHHQIFEDYDLIFSFFVTGQSQGKSIPLQGNPPIPLKDYLDGGVDYIIWI